MPGVAHQQEREPKWKVKIVREVAQKQSMREHGLCHIARENGTIAHTLQEVFLVVDRRIS